MDYHQNARMTPYRRTQFVKSVLDHGLGEWVDSQMLEPLLAGCSGFDLFFDPAVSPFQTVAQSE
jgi:hypothetical protein